jgi:hypothetical protein
MGKTYNYETILMLAQELADRVYGEQLRGDKGETFRRAGVAACKSSRCIYREMYTLGIPPRT